MEGDFLKNESAVSVLSFHVRSYFRFAAVVVALTLLPQMLAGQSYRGAIRGQVVDPSGAVVVNAKVTAKSALTGQSRETLSGPDGVYILAELPTGQYEVQR
jgi:hypothetical protein